jgi:hypothetical protein
MRTVNLHGFSLSNLGVPLQGLVRLSLRIDFEPAEIHRLFACAKSLKSLDLMRGIGSPLDVLGSSVTLNDLEELQISHTFTPAFVDSLTLPKLAVFSLARFNVNYRNGPSAPIPHWHRLILRSKCEIRALDLGNLSTPISEFIPLANSIPGVTRLGMWPNELPEELVEFLTVKSGDPTSDPFPKLEHLSVGGILPASYMDMIKSRWKGFEDHFTVAETKFKDLHVHGKELSVNVMGFDRIHMYGA